jgi:16S rRNA (cytosine967-C5)-methyltransferase
LQKKPIRSPRFRAAEILTTLYATRSPVKPLLDKAAIDDHLPDKDRKFVMQLVYGCLRNRQTIDRIIQTVSTTPLEKLDNFLHQALAIGVYQLFFLDRIPPSAAVNEAVNSCRAAGKPRRLQGFVNGVLRQMLRNTPQLKTVAANHGSNRQDNHPSWLVERWRDHFGAARTEAICAANSREPNLVLHVNTSRLTPESYHRLLANADIDFLPGKFAPAAVILPGYNRPIASLPGYQEGMFQVQDEAAQLATMLLQPFQSGGRYLDGCSGLGGKTSILLESAIARNSTVTAVEPEPYRLRKLTENMQRLFSQPPLTTIQADLLQLARERTGLFDGILIDAPCSGTGVTGRHPDIRWNRRPEDLFVYHQKQLQLSRHAASLLRPGGILVYVTCSLEPEENEQVVKQLCNLEPRLQHTDCRDFLPPAAHHLVVDGMFRPLPGELDGFFAARLRLNTEA